MNTIYQKLLDFIVTVILLLPLIFYGRQASLRPPLTEEKQLLFPGITYQRNIYRTPRLFVVHLVTIDLTQPDIKPFVTPPKYAANLNQNRAITTSNFIQKYDLQLAINGSFFYPFSERTPWNYYPQQNEPVNVLGEAIADKKRYGNLGTGWNLLCFNENNVARIVARQQCPQTTVWGIGGKDIIVSNGQSVVSNDTPAYARTVVATNRMGNKLWLIVVDGKQPFYSEGANLKEVAAIAVSLGADSALNLDGGGSTTLAVASDSGSKILNAPIHSKIPMTERPIANHLGFYGRVKTSGSRSR